MLRAALALILVAAALAGGALPASAASSGARVALIVPITVPVQSSELLTVETLLQYTSPTGLLTRQLDAVAGRAVTVAVDPLIIVSIRVLGADAPQTAVAWLDRLASAGNEMVPLPFADADLTLATQSGASALLTAPALDFAIDAARFSPPVEATADAGQTADPSTVPALPTNDDLFAWEWAVPDFVWPREGSVVGADLAALAADGGIPLLSSANVARDDATSCVVSLDSTPALVSDDAASLALRSAAGAASPETWQAQLAELSSAVVASGSAGSTIIATMDRRLPSNSPRLTDTIVALGETAGVSLVPLTSVLSDESSPATVVDRPQPTDRIDIAARLLDAELADERFATVAVEPALISGPRRLLLLGLLSQDWISQDGAWAKATTDYLDASLELRGSVQVVEASGFNLLADSASLPIAVQNDLDQAVRVFITLKPATGILAVSDDRVELVIEPNSQARGQIPVQAISNGSVTVTISLASATGATIGSTTSAEINVQAGWETPIVLVIASIVVIVFGVGIVRTILRRRRAGEEPAEEPADD